MFRPNVRTSEICLKICVYLIICKQSLSETKYVNYCTENRGKDLENSFHSKILPKNGKIQAIHGYLEELQCRKILGFTILVYFTENFSIFLYRYTLWRPQEPIAESIKFTRVGVGPVDPNICCQARTRPSPS